MPGELSRALLVSNGNVTQLARTLQGEGLIEMKRLPSDRRSSIVSSHASGTQVITSHQR